MTITEPGIYDGLHHADLPPGLSASGAKTLLRSPKQYRWEHDNPQPTNSAFELGRAFHSFVLGAGATYQPVEQPRTTKAGKSQALEITESGAVPMPRKDFDTASAMAEAVKSHPVASAIFARGRPETAVIWEDEATGVTCRGFIDWLTPVAIVDLKSAQRADEADIERSLVNYGYAIQAALYVDGYAAITGRELPFLLVACEKAPPHLIRVCQLDDEVIQYGREKYRLACEVYRDCVESGVWPEWTHVRDDIATVALPRWAS